MVAAFELMKLGLKPVVYEAARIGGRLRSVPFEGAEGIVAELGGMRFPICSTAFFHYLDQVGLETTPFPNPLTSASHSTVVDLAGQPIYAEKLERSAEDLPRGGGGLERGAGAWRAVQRHAGRDPRPRRARGSRRSGTA